jgi:Ser/Thr protein kinase RdoA (MazF antagonist)
MSIENPPPSIIEHYFPKTEKVQTTALGAGNINDTFLVQSAKEKFVLQRINGQVFPDPQVLIHNLQQLSQHIQSRQKTETQRWEYAVIVSTLSGQLSVQDNKGNLWRALSYIDKSLSVTKVNTSLQAKQTGWALGHFHNMLMGLNVQTLQIPLPGFHHLSSYLKCYDTLKTTKPITKRIESCKYIIQLKRNAALSLERAAREGQITQRVIHGDPKIANILFDQKTGKAVSIIDLDTVGPGFIQHDIGDCLRSICNTGGEKGHADDTKFDLKLCELTLNGYFQEAAALLSPMDKEYIYDGIQAIAFELGLRFFTDYLQGNIYFKCANPDETLEMALVQFALYQDITDKEAQIREIISNLNTISD